MCCLIIIIIYTTKDELRKVTYSIDGAKVYRGYFHQWLTKKNSVDSEYVEALIEDKVTGIVHEIGREKVRFES